MRETISAVGPQSIDYDSESFDPPGPASLDYDFAFTDLLRQKYRALKFDIVIAIQTAALDFVLKHRAELWPKAAVVFLGVPNDIIRQRHLGPRVTGIAGAIDFAGTLGLAFRLQPNAERVVVVSGVTQTEQSWVALVRRALRPFEARVQITYLTQHTVSEILSAVSSLPKDSIVLYLSMFEDAAGQTTISGDIAAQLARRSAAPVYSFYERFMGMGIVGGSLTDFDNNAQRLGKLLALILAGTNPDEIPLAPPAANLPTVDWRQLARWGFDEARLPPGTVVLFRQATLWQVYRWQIVGAATIIAIETLLIVALLAQRRRRKRAESAMTAQNLTLAHANTLLTSSEAKNRAILNALPDLMFLQTVDGVYLDYHCKEPRDLWLPAEQFLGKKMSEVLPTELAKLFLHCFKHAAESGEPVVHEYSLPIDKQTRHFEARMIRFGNEQILTMVRDITERKQAEQLLCESESVLKTIMDHSPAIVFLKDREGRYLYTNPQFSAMSGLPPEQMAGKTDSELFSAEQAAAFCANDRAVIDNGEAMRFEETAEHKDGPHTSVVYKFPLFDEHGRIYATGGIAADITERKQSEEALRESEERFRNLADSAPVMIWMSGPDKLCNYFNKVWLDFTGRSIEQELGNGWAEGVHSADYNRCLETYVTAFEARQSFRMEYRLRRHDGEYRWIFDEGLPRYGPDHSFQGYIGSATDITPRKQAEEALHESEGRYRNVVDTQTELICRYLPDTTLTFVNDAYCRYFSKSREELIGKKFIELIPSAVRPAVIEHIENLCTHPEVRTKEHEHEVVRPDGSVGWQRWTNHVLLDFDGRVREMQGVGRDITDRKRAEEELQGAMAEIRQLKDRLEAENVYLRSEVSGVHRDGGMVGESEGMGKVMEQVERVAPTDMTVLVLGETGVGKELVARMVHEKSGRRERPLVKVNCSTLPAELIESELFGHERGAFTGAVSKQVGRFELADEGTIFLDEVGELPLSLQAKLLRVLQEGEFERLGSGKTIKVDVRVIAATNRNLSEAAQQGRFRTDLYYRLNVYPIEVPPLRERQEDIKSLAEVFLEESAKRLGKRFGKLTQDTIEALRQYSWPGNVRELENVIARAAIISNPPTLQLPEGWNREICAFQDSAVLKSNHSVHSNSEATNHQQEPLAALEKAHIVEILQQTNWRIEGPKGAALILGLHPNTLRSRMHKLGIQRPRRNTNGDADPMQPNRSVESQS
jgi:PAS domain S-box-containing protein